MGTSEHDFVVSVAVLAKRGEELRDRAGFLSSRIIWHDRRASEDRSELEGVEREIANTKRGIAKLME